MFTGIVSDIGEIVAHTQQGDARFDIKTNYNTQEIAIGASVSCAGVCLTVIEKEKSQFAVQVSKETLDLTTAQEWQIGTRLNLERALQLGDELGGHIVSGHVDGIGTIKSIKQEGESKRFTFAAPKSLMGLIAPKGSVVVDGVSFTVNEIGAESFGVNIIPHTQSVTTFGNASEGDKVNLEIDVLARYVARLLEWKEGNV